jgi:hypothetical protein
MTRDHVDVVEVEVGLAGPTVASNFGFCFEVRNGGELVPTRSRFPARANHNLGRVFLPRISDNNEECVSV